MKNLLSIKQKNGNGECEAASLKRGGPTTRLLACLLFIGTACGAFASSNGLVVVGNTADESTRQMLTDLARRTRRALVARGVPNVTILEDNVGRASILDGLSAMAAQTGPNDECWVVLFGYGGRGRNHEPTFQIKGQRLGASDLHDAIAKIPGRKWVFIGTSQSGAFLPFLKLPGCAALAATDDEGELSAPRFPEKWVDALEQAPTTPFAKLATRAAEQTRSFYSQQSLAVVEHARLLDPVSGEILAAPFDANAAVPATATPTRGDGATRLNPSEIEVPNSKSDELFQTVPPSDETRALIANAKERNCGDYEAIVTRREVSLTVNADRSVTEDSKQRVFLATPDAVSRWASQTFTHTPPAFETKIRSARLILPDGASVVLRPEKLEPDHAPPESGMESTIHFEFPQAVPGSLVEVAWQSNFLPDSTLPQFYREAVLETEIPVAETDLTLKLSKSGHYHYLLRNNPAQPEETETEYSRVLHWKLGALPAWEPLPFDPPARDGTVWLGISSFDSWDDFSGWYCRITKGANEITSPVQAKADEIKRAYNSRMQRMKAAFEFVASLRYVAVECGIAGFRARTPEEVLTKRYGDCKDKANLLTALLRAMDIPANFALVNRMSSTDPDFPGWQFNHALAFIPAAPNQGQSSEMWLDSTDSTTPFGALAPGDVGRSALVFEKESARFRTIQTSGTTLIRDEWDCSAAGKNGGGEGHFRGRRTGLADDAVRKQLRSESPLQRRFALCSMLNEMNPGTEFANLKITDLSDLATPVDIQADFAVKDPSLVRAPSVSSRFGSMALLPERDRPLWANDGQPLRYEQTIQYPAPSNAALPAPFEAETAGWHCSVQFTRKGHCCIRSAICEIRAPKVATADYPALRKTVRLWLENVNSPLPCLSR